jgi:hypothetical protein
MSVRLDWHGEEVAKRVASATVVAMDEVDEAVADAARHDHPGWQSRTGDAEASIAAAPVQAGPGGVRGGAGYGVGYGRFLEFTARGHPGDRTITRAMERLGRELARRIGEHIER